MQLNKLEIKKKSATVLNKIIKDTVIPSGAEHVSGKWSGAGLKTGRFYPSLVTFWGTLVANDAKIVYFTFYVYFPGVLEPRCFLRAMMGPPLDMPLCGAGPKIE